jgi:dimethylargininase
VRKLKFTRAIVRRPGSSIINGISSANLGKPDYNKALFQHSEYVAALSQCGLMVIELEAEEKYPDSTFVEDTALLTPHCAVITNPGATTRAGEIHSIKPVIREYFEEIELISPPGTVEAGDIMMVGDHYYIGLSARTNLEGANQVIRILEKYGMTGSSINLEKVLHLKTGVSYLENDNLLACGEFLAKPEFNKFNIIEVPSDESYAANSLWINNKVLVPLGYPISKERIEAAGYSVIEVDTSEFKKLDGGLSCLSLRF